MFVVWKWGLPFDDWRGRVCRRDVYYAVLSVQVYPRSRGLCASFDCATAKLCEALAGTVILQSESHGTHDHILSNGTGSLSGSVAAFKLVTLRLAGYRQASCGSQPKSFLQLNPYGNSPCATSSLTREWGYLLLICLATIKCAYRMT
jgi:hypothetical protein